MRKIVLMMMVLFVMAVFFTGCNQPPVVQQKITVTDAMGTEVVLEKAPEKIIALTPSDVEILYALGAQDQIVAVGEFCNYPEDASNKKALGSGDNTNVEAILELEPDAVIIAQMAQTEGIVEQLRQSGIAVIVSSSQTIEDTYNAIGLIGRVVGKADEADKLVNEMKEGFAELKEQAAKKDKVRVYAEVSPLQFGLWTCGQGTFIHELMEIVGVENVFAEVQGWGQISEEQVLDKNPDVIITTVGVAYGVEKPVEDILSRENWKDIHAVVGKKVYMLDADMTARPGPRLLDAAREMYQLIYGE